jgi:hypothetical protein
MTRRGSAGTVAAISILAITLGGCASAQRPSQLPGAMNIEGSIGPCRGDGRDVQACGDAIFNATVISRIHTGQTQTEVRSIMRHVAERHEMVGDVESWGYITSYQNKMLTWISFTDHRVSSLSHEVWVRD